MTNLNRPTIGADPGVGRRVLDQVTDELSRRLKEVSTSRPFFAFVAVAAIVLGFYFFILAAPIYVSQSNFSIRGREAPPVAGSLLASLGAAGGGGGDASGVETAEISQYILSQDMLSKLDKRYHLRDVYSRPRLDFARWMPRSASQEKFLAFYRKMVNVRIDHDTNIVTVTVRGFDGPSAQTTAEAILEIAADYIDGLSSTVRKDTVRASEQELKEAEDAVRDARLAMTKYRVNTGMVDPAATAAARSGAVEAMQNQVLGAQADIASLMTYNTANSPQVVQLRAKVTALQGQIADAQRHLTSGSKTDTMAQKLYDYEGLAVKSEYAERALVAAMGSNDSARALASQRERFLVRITNPNLPDQATEPKRLVAFIEALLVLVAVYGIIALAIAGVRDHQGI